MRPEDLTRHDLGRRTRDVSPPLRSLLGVIDGERCRFPSCTRRTNLHAHHVVYWSRGGPTDLANLVLVCARHHTVVHAQDFRLVLSDDRSLRVHSAEGTAVLHHPALPWRPAEELDPGRQIGAQTLPSEWNGDPLDLSHAVWVMLQHAA